MPEHTRHVGYLIALITFFSVALGAYAQETTPDDPYAADRAELLQIKDQYETAVQSGELDKLKSLIAEGYYGVMVTGHETKSFEELKDYWLYILGLMGEGGTYEVEVLPEPALFSGNHAISHGKTRETVTASGNSYNFESRWTAVFVKESGAWKVLRLHASMDPIDNVFVHAARKQAAIWSAVIAAVAGVTIGCTFVGLLCRRKAK